MELYPRQFDAVISKYDLIDSGKSVEWSLLCNTTVWLSRLLSTNTRTIYFTDYDIDYGFNSLALENKLAIFCRETKQRTTMSVELLESADIEVIKILLL